MTEQWVTVATFSLHPQAVLAKSALDAAGIQCWLRDEHLVRMLGTHSAPFGGIKLQVLPEDEPAARAVLQESQTETPELNAE